MIHLFPYLLSRSTTGSYRDFVGHRFTLFDALIDRQNTLLSHKTELQARLNTSLYALINVLGNKYDQQHMLRVKRDIFNGRQIDLELTGILPLPVAVRDDLRSYITLTDQLAAWDDSYQIQYQNVLEHARRSLQSLSANENFLSSLSLSSKALALQLPFYQAAQFDRFTKSDLQTEISVLRYLTRMYFKTSPFSQLTNIGLVRFSDEDQRPVKGTVALESQVRINNHLLYFIKTLLTSHSKIRLFLPVRLNPTLSLKANYYEFLLNYSNIEAFQRVPTNPVTDLIYEIVSERKGCTVQELTKMLMEKVDSTEEKLTAFLIKLTEFGLIEFSLDASGSDPNWDLSLTTYLKQLPSTKLIDELVCFLKMIRGLAEEFTVSACQNRTTILSKATVAFQEVSRHFMSDMGISYDDLALDKQYRQRFIDEYQQNNQLTVKPYLQPDFTLFYEDAVNPVLTTIDSQGLQSIVEPLDMLVGQLQAFDHFTQERQIMLYHFNSTYQKNESVPLLDFYRTYYEAIKKPQKELMAKPADDLLQNPVQLTLEFPGLQQSLNLYKEKLTSVLDCVMDEFREVIDISMADLNKVMPQDHVKSKNTSSGAFIQLFLESDHGQDILKGVVNGMFTGMGRSSGRFLHLFDEPVSHEFRKYNSRLHSELDIVAELTDASYFNANLHPALLDFQIVLPGGHSGCDQYEDIPVSGLLVCIDHVHNELMLQHQESGKRVYPYDVCLQSLSTRSELYQLLVNFSSSRSHLLDPFVDTVLETCRKKFPSQTHMEDGVWRYPRIVLNQTTILRRQRWYVEKQVLPLQQKSETDSTYFLRLRNWLKRIGIGSEVFIYINPNGWEAGSTQAGKVGKDDYKPQYIDFENPLLVRLFEKQIKKVPDVLCIEEMFPDTTLLSDNNVEHVNEMLVEWYNLK